ncbi:hypothetical protein DFH29DRAFT_1003214 [Suillus ampliporus]|nr:hypothetical protein DFH29DRAFT_1003214 [Suillus ampliporus]
MARHKHSDSTASSASSASSCSSNSSISSVAPVPPKKSSKKATRPKKRRRSSEVLTNARAESDVPSDLSEPEDSEPGQTMIKHKTKKSGRATKPKAAPTRKSSRK